MTSSWERHYMVKAVHMVDNSGSTSHSIITCLGPEIFVQINRILTKFFPWKLGIPVIMTHHVLLKRNYVLFSHLFSELLTVLCLSHYGHRCAAYPGNVENFTVWRESPWRKDRRHFFHWRVDATDTNQLFGNVAVGHMSLHCVSKKTSHLYNLL